MEDLISRQASIDALHMHLMYRMGTDSNKKRLDDWINALPSAQTEPLSDAYMKAVWNWLIDYQIKSAELQGRYTPYEVLSWWRMIGEKNMNSDLISRRAAIKAICEDGTWLESQGCTEITMAERKQRDADILGELPSAQSDWDEMLVICDCCGHAIHVKRL